MKSQKQQHFYTYKTIHRVEINYDLCNRNKEITPCDKKIY